MFSTTSNSKLFQLSETSTNTQIPSASNRAKPRTGLAQTLLNAALSSPLWKLVLVPKARQNIVDTAQANGIQWEKSYEWLKSQKGPWQTDKKLNDVFPEYYQKEFHAYQDGNLCWNAAIEQELASRAVGARNFPAQGPNGEDAFRSAFESAILKQSGRSPETLTGIVLDLGCGTGTSTRRLAELFPNASKLVGMDLSPYFIQVGQSLLDLAPKKESEEWVTTIIPDERVELRVGDATNTNLDDESVDVLNLSLVIHELPVAITLEVCREALRVLKPGGQLFVSEMDFDSPAYAAQRENALLFSLLRATEPYLDDYADGCEEIREFLVANFDTVKITAATGRHYAMVATKSVDPDSSVSGKIQDSRFDSNGNYSVDDTHLKVWESKE
jgi:ubiquinone/menaquinone biosynthesis C-methylase UbiE